MARGTKTSENRTVPNFERVRKVLLLQGEPDRVPLAELKVDRGVKDAFMGRPVDDLKTDVEFWEEAGYDFIRFRPEYDFQYAGSISHKAGYSLYGNGMEERKWAEEGKGVITNMEEFERFPWPKARDINYSKLEEVSKYLPDGMKLITSSTGIWESVWMLMGLEGFSYALVENPPLIENMFAKLGQIHLDIFRNAITFPSVGAMWYTDDIAYTEGFMVSPDILRKYVFPWVKSMGELCKEYDMPFLYHSDGDIREVLPDLIDCGVNAIQPVEPKAMDIRELKKEFGKKLAFIGNVDLGYTLTRGTPDEVREEVKGLIRDLAPGGGYCIGSSNSIPNYVPLENYKAMLEAAKTYGEYPIAI